MRSTPPRRGAPLRFAPMSKKGNQRTVTAPRFVLPCSCRDEERPARFALASGAGRTRNNVEQAKASKAAFPSAGRRPCAKRPTEHLSNAASARSPAPREAQEPMPHRPRNPAPQLPHRLANLTPAGVPILAPSRFANPSPMTSPAGSRLFCIFDARHGTLPGVSLLARRAVSFNGGQLLVTWTAATVH
jgi:hypothetical protein